MRPRTFLLLILVLLMLGVLAVILIANMANGSPLAGLLPGAQVDTPTPMPPAEVEPGLPPPTPTPPVRLQQVVVAVARIPVGERIRAELIETQMRPDTNIALQGGYTFSEPDEVIGQITRVEIPSGEAILTRMLALDPTDLGAFGSDLALYIDRGNVAVAFPINRYSGAAYAMRSGDFVDVLMTLRAVEIDPDFRTALPNLTERVIQSELLAGQAFLFEETVQGRLEFIQGINQVAEIVPSSVAILGQDFDPGRPIPRRITQLTIQRAEVLWVGTWRDPRELEEAQAAAQAAALQNPEVFTTPTPIPEERFDRRPDVVILSMTAQDALTLKWALERGINIDLALRAQGDNSVFVTTSVTLPQIIEQGAMTIPPLTDFDLHPRADEVPLPGVPPEPPQN